MDAAKWLVHALMFTCMALIAGCSALPVHTTSIAQNDGRTSTNPAVALPAVGQKVRLHLHDGGTLDLRVSAVDSHGISGTDTESGAAIRIAATDIQQWQRRPSVATRVVVIAVVASALLYFVAQAAAAGALLSGGL